MLTAVLIISIANLVLQIVAVWQRHRAIQLLREE